MTRQGVVIRSLSGFYTVRCGGDTIECRARGRFRHDGSSPLVGDRVSIETQPDGSGTVRELLPRRCAFARPAVANVELLVLVLCAAIPVTDPFLVDQLTVRCEKNHCGVIIAVNKSDLADGSQLADIYRSAGYPVVPLSAVTGEGIEELRELIRGRITCFTGNTGAGKSSILNALNPMLTLETGEVSRKLGRGRHTTRHVELFEIMPDTFAADTPGFAAFDALDEEPIRKTQMQTLFPEFAPFLGKCRFDDCLHLKEPDCAVRLAVANGVIHPSRYASYEKLCAQAAKLNDWELV